MADRYGYAAADDEDNQEAPYAAAASAKRRATRTYAQAANHTINFRPFTRESLTNVQQRKQSKGKRSSSSARVANQIAADSTRVKLEPDPYLASGQQLPPVIARQLPRELIGKPIEDIDPYYADQETFVIISRGNELTRFSAKDALYLLGPFHPIRRVVLYILVSSIFNLFVITTILTNCILMTFQGNDMVEKTEIIFTIIYTTEMSLKVLARGFIFDEFTYLRDPWNWLDFLVIIMAYLTIVIKDLGNLSVMRTFRVLRALKTVAIIPGMKTIVGAVIDSVKNLKDVVVLTLFSLSVFSLLGLQIYMGILTQKCIRNGPTNMTDSDWFKWCSDNQTWIPEEDDEIWGAWRLCGNATGAQSCPPDYTCLQGFGPNPDYGFTNFDTFGWALICSFRLMTQDFWEGLYMQVLKTAGSWHIIFFLVSIFLGSIYLMNLILAIVAMSYNELQRRAEEEEEAAAEDEAAFLESCRLMERLEQFSHTSSASQGARSNAHSRPSSDGAAASYRPSVEIGLVGQSLLASLCKNGLLSEQIRAKLNEQMMLPLGDGVNGEARDVELCASSFDEGGVFRASDALSSQQAGDCGRSKRHRNSGRLHCLPQYDPLTVAKSMTELRRKSSVRTNESATGSPVSRSNEGSLVGQRRLLPNIGLSGKRLDAVGQQTPLYGGGGGLQLGPNSRQSSPKRAYVSSRGMLRKHSEFNQADADRVNFYHLHRFPARASTTSDRDLQVLKQKAAMIRIAAGFSANMRRAVLSNDSSGDVQSSQNQTCSNSLESVSSKRRAELCRRRATRVNSTASKFREDSLLCIPGQIYQSEVAICGQPTSLRPLGKLCGRKQDSSRLRRFSSNCARDGSSLGASLRRRRESTSASGSRRCSTFSSGEQTGSQQTRAELAGEKLAKSNLDVRSGVGIGFGGEQPRLSPTAPRQLGAELVERLGGPAGKMHHLSVENFQRFGGASRRASAAAAQQQQQRLAGRDSPELSASATGLPVAEQSQQFPVADFERRVSGSRQSLRQRGARLTAAATATEAFGRNVLPATMARTSFSDERQRRSFAATGAGLPGHAYRLGDGAGGLMSRRVSREFSRRASDWSRLSMSANVDLRRLLRLWSHTNPYHSRPSVGSACEDSTAAAPFRFAQVCAEDGPLGSPAHSSVGRNADSARLSSRPSSVGSAWQAYGLMAALSRHRNQRYQSEAAARYGALPLDDSLQIDQVSVNARDKCLAYCLSCLDVLCIWECCGAWLKVQRIIALLVFDPFTELFIILCILINTLFMALDSDDADEQMRSIFERGNYFFTATFAVEAAMKILALSPKFYFREGWNVFDSIIVGLSLLELGLEGVYGLSVLRSFRLLRVFKLAKSWPTLNLLISIMGKAVGDLGNLTFVLAIIVFIFAVMGMQLFGNKYVAHSFPSGELPRWNFTDFMHSFMIVFRILCAEWIEPMWDCLLVGGWPCIPFFLIAVTVGNLVVLNLFLALLLASFGASNLSSPQADNVDTKKLQIAVARFGRFASWSRKSLRRLLARLTDCVLCRKPAVDLGINSTATGGGSGGGANASGSANGHDSGDGKVLKSRIVAMSRMERQQNIEKRTEELKRKIQRSPEHHYHLKQLAKLQLEDSRDGQQVAAAGCNYNYEQKNKYRVLRRDRQTMSHEQPPRIPIIVNELIESGEDTAIGDGSSAGNKRHEFQSNDFERSSPTESEESRSLSCDVSLRGCDFNSSDERPDFCAGSSRALNVRQHNLHSSYSLMQPIKEDPKDDYSAGSSQASSLNGGGGGGTDNGDGNSLAVVATATSSIDKLTTCSSLQTIVQMPPAYKSAQASPISGLSGSCGEFLNKRREHVDTNEPNEEDLGDETQETASLLIGQSRLAPSKEFDEQSPSLSLEQQQLPTQAAGFQMVVATIEQDDNTARSKSSLYLKAPKRQEMEEEDERTLQHIEGYIERCIWIGIICLKWFIFRQYVRKIVEHKYFDRCILILIVISSGTLALEDKHLHERPILKQTLDILDTIFTIIFSLEMIFKWLAFGMRRYFGNMWSWLDFVIVLVSLINLMASIFGSGKIQALKTMRTLRAMRGLRPLRALQRFQGMRVVVNALIQAIPSIFNVLLVCLIFWLIFSIMGVQMFGGKFWRCLDPKSLKVVSYEVAANKFECIERNLTWSNPQINFDNVPNAYLALFQVATFKGWIDIMNSATDSRSRDDQPIREANIYMYFYFVFFVIFGSFFTLNLFIGVIIDNFNEQKKKTGGSLEIFMTEDQKKYYHAMKKMRSKKPVKAMTRPKFKLQAYTFDITTSKKFDLVIMIIIGLNMFVMALEHYGQSQEFSHVLENLNLIFIAIFTLECFAKIFAMRHFYFREPWNIFDFIVVSLSILGVVMKEYIAKYFVSPTLLRVVRVVKVGRVLRLVKGAKGIRTLLFALAMSLPALFNICLLLFLVMFIYAIFGMSFFMNVRKRSGIDETFNFETFTSSITVLFQMSTSAGWDLVLDPLMDEENDCQKPDPAAGIEGTCGNRSIAIFYLVSYVIVTFLIIINMYIAVILENYSQATEDVQEGLTDDDYEMYYEIWQKFDPNGTQYLPFEKLSDFVDALEEPLRIPKPNELALVVMDINIYENNLCYCVDILDALTKYFFIRKGLDIQVNEHLQKVQSTLHETPFERITTTYLVKREHYCAKLIQNCWRKWRLRTQNQIADCDATSE